MSNEDTFTDFLVIIRMHGGSAFDRELLALELSVKVFL